MLVKRHIDKVFGLVLVAVTLAVAAVFVTQLGRGSSARGSGGAAAASVTGSQGESPGIPPILPAVPSELAAGRLPASRALVNHVASNARYSTAVFNGYGTTRR